MKTYGKTLKHGIQRGFTLIELVVVVAVIGVLIAIVAPNITGSRDGANAQLMVRSANSIAQNWQMIHQQCGTNSAVTGNAVGDIEDIIFAGTGVNATYQACYTQARVLPLTEISVSTGTGFRIANYPVTITGGGTAPLSVTYADVPETLVLSIVQRYDSSVGALPAGASSTGAYSISGPQAGNTRSITIIKRI